MTNSRRARPRVAVLGAGALGTLTALGLARRGTSVDLIDDRPRPWDGASVAGEGKVHLGYVYARATDESLHVLLASAGRFAHDFEAAVGRTLPWPRLVSSPFEYLVAPDSSIGPDDFESHADRIASLAAAHGTGSSYVGPTPSLQVRPLDRTPRGSLFSTPERSVLVPRLRAIVIDALAASPLIRHVRDHRAVDVELGGGTWKIAVENRNAGSSGTLGPYHAVVNCAWEGAPALDRLAGQTASDPPNLRLRAFLHGWTSGSPRAVTVTHGPYGDFVRFEGGRTYASWYPTGVLGFCEATSPPEPWRPLQSGVLDAPDLAASMIEGLSALVPEAREIRDVTVRARIVVASGSTDIDDPSSRLHDRTGAAIDHDDGWISVRSPKLTTAPTMARRAAVTTGDVLS